MKRSINAGQAGDLQYWSQSIAIEYVRRVNTVCQFDDMRECEAENGGNVIPNVKKPLKAKADNGFLLFACRACRPCLSEICQKYLIS
jgi:nitrate reductase beta subunit